MRTTTGRIAAFDQHAGFGTVRMDDGTELFFHCTAIVDGSRMIEVGTLVAFERVPGHHGRWEASGIRPLPGGGRI
ncbi:MAG: cold shock domain-containing protein [Actinomycetota bacterium]|nr:cold shock domain-containing protein [Actinomycetota bacterium]